MQHSVIPGGWDKPEVAAAQQDLVIRELSVDSATIGPYAAFRWAMDTIKLERGMLLDAGCGVGHYGVLCERFYPGIRYFGTDLSIPMIAFARNLAPLGVFSVCEFRANHFENFDIVLTGQTLEVTDDPPGSLDILLTRARHYIILNRIRVTEDESYRIFEGTYCDNTGQTWLWNLADITRRIEARAEILARRDWENQATFVIRANDDSD
jgi:SAM-dependent methyltransferase